MEEERNYYQDEVSLKLRVYLIDNEVDLKYVSESSGIRLSILKKIKENTGNEDIDHDILSWLERFLMFKQED